jgi:2-amino-4-hydroxy-6-hydroxymethyldihydropteridine diphosphokinase
MNGNTPTTLVALALGSNLGDRLAYLRAAIAALSSHLTITDKSRIYETAAAYVTDQPSFLNAAILGTTQLNSNDLLAAIKKIEIQVGRIETFRFGPRVIDIDILYHGNSVVQSSELILPHPKITERDFVLRPLADIAPNWTNPVTQQTTIEMLDKFAGQNYQLYLEDL